MTNRVVYVIGHYETESVLSTTRPFHFEVHEQYSKFYKIGVTNDVEARLRQLNAGTPHTLKLETVIESGNAKRVESKLHTLFSQSRHQGEWFQLLDETVEELRQITQLNADELNKIGVTGMELQANDSLSLSEELGKVRGEVHE